jgi:type I restriction enzyme S subunit
MVKVLEGWSQKKLTELAKYINGYAFKPEDWGKEGLPIIRIEQLKNSNASTDYFSGRLPAGQVIQNGDLIFSWSASLFLRIWDRGQAALNQHLFKVVEFKGVDRTFLKNFIEFYLPELAKASHGSTMQHITRKELERFKAFFPSYQPEQAKIAEILSTVDQAIEKSEALIAKHQRIKVGMMQDLLSSGIDAQGKLRSEKIHQFKDSLLGRIPVEWEVERLDNLLIEKRYGISTSLSDEPDGIPVLRMNNLVKGEVDYTNLKYSQRNDALRLTLRDGDILFNRTNSIDYVGRTGIYRDSGRSISFASYLVRLVTNKEKLCAEYLNLWLNDLTNQIKVKRFATIGVQQANVNPTNLGTLLVSFPKSTTEQNKIVNLLESASRGINEIDRSLQKLRSLKTALMQDLLTGNKTVTTLLSNMEVKANGSGQNNRQEN